MFLRDLVESGAMPALEMTARFAARRQEILAHNIANIDTPGFIPRQVSTRAFQEALGRAIDRRRASGGDALELEATREVRMTADGLALDPRTPSGNILFHDRSNRDLERMMADLAENVGVFRLATDLLRTRHGLIASALAERVA